MGSAERHPEVKVQELQVAIFSPQERHLAIEPIPVVQEMGFRKDDNRGDCKGERLQQPGNEKHVVKEVAYCLHNAKNQ